MKAGDVVTLKTGLFAGLSFKVVVVNDERVVVKSMISGQHTECDMADLEPLPCVNFKVGQKGTGEADQPKEKTAEKAYKVTVMEVRLYRVDCLVKATSAAEAEQLVENVGTCPFEAQCDLVEVQKSSVEGVEPA